MPIVLVCVPYSTLKADNPNYKFLNLLGGVLDKKLVVGAYGLRHGCELILLTLIR